jgi:hypothetical protein
MAQIQDSQVVAGDDYLSDNRAVHQRQHIIFDTFPLEWIWMFAEQRNKDRCLAREIFYAVGLHLL